MRLGTFQATLILSSWSATLLLGSHGALVAAQEEQAAEPPQLEAFHADAAQAIIQAADITDNATAKDTSVPPSPPPAVPACHFPFEECSPRHAAEKQRLLKQRLDKKSSGKWDTNHPRWRLLKAIDAFQSYGRVNRAEIKRWRDMYGHVPKEQKNILESAAGVSHKKKLNHLEHLIAANEALTDAIARHSMEYYGINDKELHAFIRAEESAGRASERHSVVQAIKHYVRDWSLEGAGERDAAFPCILSALRGVVAGVGGGEEGLKGDGEEKKEKEPLKVLLPGSGLGRLGHEVASLGGLEVTINEWSTYMIAAYRYLEAHMPTSDEQTAAAASADEQQSKPAISFYPFIDSLSHHATNDNLFRKVTLSPLSSQPLSPSSPSSSSPSSASSRFSPSKVLLVEGDFTTVFSSQSNPAPLPQQQQQQQQYDIIITHFFIDTARNLMSYLATIHALLRPGTGRWINFGPLLYGTGPWVQLSLDEIVLVCEAMGFEFEDIPAFVDDGRSPGRGEGQGGSSYQHQQQPHQQQEQEQHVCGTLTFPDRPGGGGLAKIRGRHAGYGFDELALTSNAYMAQAWVARRKE